MNRPLTATERATAQARKPSANGKPRSAASSKKPDTPATPHAGPQFELIPAWAGKKCQLTAMVGGEVAHLHTFDPTNATQRKRFAKDVHGKHPTIPPEAVEGELLRIATAGSTPPPPRSTAGVSEEIPAEVVEKAEGILRDPELVGRVCDDVAALGVAGERELVLTVYLIGVSRLLSNPLAGIVRGSSSSGKSFLIERVASLFPPEAVILATQMTPQALVHMPAGTLEHVWVVAGERSRLQDDDRAEATRALREMLSAGRLSKLMPTKGPDGKIVSELIEQEGPIAFIESTTLTTIFEEDANRCLLLGTDESEEQSRRIVNRLADRHASPEAAASEQVKVVHHALQRLLPRVEVRVPFANRIAKKLDCTQVEVRRAFPQLLTLIQACALLHFRQRESAHDGALLATATDYQIARQLISKPFALSLGGGISESAIQFFRLLSEAFSGEFTTADAKKQAKGGKSSVYSWLTELHEGGAVEQGEPGRGNRPAKWRLTGREPVSGAAVIPKVEEIFPEYRNRGSNVETAGSEAD